MGLNRQSRLSGGMSALPPIVSIGGYRAKISLCHKVFLHARFPAFVLGKPSGSIGPFSWKRRVRTGTVAESETDRACHLEARAALKSAPPMRFGDQAVGWALSRTTSPAGSQSAPWNQRIHFVSCVDANQSMPVTCSLGSSRSADPSCRGRWWCCHWSPTVPCCGPSHRRMWCCDHR